jgi:methylmalonyl-CoA/ethylmalonyl-CoA epimerase
MLKKVDHVGIAVPNIQEALKFWAAGLANDVEREETIESQKARIAFLPVGDVDIELLEPTAPDSPIAKFIDKRGPGVHHVCFQVADLDAAAAHLRGLGFEMATDKPVRGGHGKWIQFVHPKSANGVLIELSQVDNGD